MRRAHPDSTEPTVLVSISGGRTSGFMAWWMSSHQEAVADWLGCQSVKLSYVFANTGLEHDDTLRFLRDIQNNFGIPIVWVEGEAVHGERRSTRHRIVSFETAFRLEHWRDRRHPFHDHVVKYGVPNVKFINCTREMKRNTIDSYMKSIGHPINTYYTAIGIREDEGRRVSKNSGARHIIYPLVDLEPTCKDDVTDWWSQFDFDLNIPEWLGNCVTCYKKSSRKVALAHRDCPAAFEFCEGMEQEYSTVGPEFAKYGDSVPRTFWRGNMSTKDLLAIFKDGQQGPPVEDGGCSESCELYETEGDADV